MSNTKTDDGMLDAAMADYAEKHFEEVSAECAKQRARAEAAELRIAEVASERDRAKAERDEALLNCKRITEEEFLRRADAFRPAGTSLTPLGKMLVGLTAERDAARAERDEARAAVQSACDVAVTAACAAVEAERDAAYAQRDACADEAAMLRETLQGWKIQPSTIEGTKQLMKQRAAALSTPSVATEWRRKRDMKIADAERAYFRSLLLDTGGAPAKATMDEVKAALIEHDARIAARHAAEASVLREALLLVEVRGIMERWLPPDVYVKMRAALATPQAATEPGLPPPQCPGPDCLMCNGAACNKCGAGCWARPYSIPLCRHDVVERHESPPDAASLLATPATAVLREEMDRGVQTGVEAATVECRRCGGRGYLRLLDMHCRDCDGSGRAAK